MDKQEISYSEYENEINFSKYKEIKNVANELINLCSSVDSTNKLKDFFDKHKSKFSSYLSYDTHIDLNSSLRSFSLGSYKNFRNITLNITYEIGTSKILKTELYADINIRKTGFSHIVEKVLLTEINEEKYNKWINKAKIEPIKLTFKNNEYILYRNMFADLFENVSYTTSTSSSAANTYYSFRSSHRR